jgi:hypothetical protein
MTCPGRLAYQSIVNSRERRLGVCLEGAGAFCGFGGLDVV